MGSLNTVADEVLKAAEACGLTLVTAESCTAGKLAHVLSKAKGASKYLHGGIVAYTKPMKSKALGVSDVLLIEKTAVCAEVARAMAEGALRCATADIAVSITGVAGPEPDEDGNPVGLVFCAAARRNGETKHIKLNSKRRNPEAILEDAMLAALTLMKSMCDAEVAVAP